MSKFSTVRNTFVKQLSAFDCGPACLSMILNYSGRGAEIAAFRSNFVVTDFGMSLFEMRNQAKFLGFECRCVEMDRDYLKTLKKPVILHVLNQYNEYHYVVCFGSRNRNGKVEFLLADPAKHFFYCDEFQLDEIWESRAALYFDNLQDHPFDNVTVKWLWKACRNLVPPALWCSVPLINIAAMFCGVTITWALQQGLKDSLTDKSFSYLIALPVLLLIISMFKSLLGFVRQVILLMINTRISREFTFRFVENVISQRDSETIDSKSINLKHGLNDTRKIQSGLATFISSTLTEGSFLFSALILLAYFFPLACIVVVLYIMISVIFVLKDYPKAAYLYAERHQAFSNAEQRILNEIPLLKRLTGSEVSKKVYEHQSFHDDYINSERKIGLSVVKQNLLLECIGNCTVMIVFTLGLIRLEKSMDYNSFMLSVVLSFLITSILPRLSASYFIVAEAFDSALQHSINYP